MATTKMLTLLRTRQVFWYHEFSEQLVAVVNLIAVPNDCKMPQFTKPMS